jgi:hypothetical protein
VLVVAIGGSLLVLWMVMGAPPEPIKTANSVRDDVDETKNFEKDDVARFGNFEVTINQADVNYQSGKSDVAPLIETNRFVLLNITAKNVDQVTRALSDIDLALLADETVINMSFFRIDPAFEFGTIEPGAEVTGNILFELPPNISNLKLYYNTQMYDNEQEQLKRREYTLPF